MKLVFDEFNKLKSCFCYRAHIRAFSQNSSQLAYQACATYALCLERDVLCDVFGADGQPCQSAFLTFARFQGSRIALNLVFASAAAALSASQSSIGEGHKGSYYAHEPGAKLGRKSRPFVCVSSI
jgi:hypothetical protein